MKGNNEESKLLKLSASPSGFEPAYIQCWRWLPAASGTKKERAPSLSVEPGPPFLCLIGRRAAAGTGVEFEPAEM